MKMNLQDQQSREKYMHETEQGERPRDGWETNAGFAGVALPCNLSGIALQFPLTLQQQLLLLVTMQAQV
jgi:hypothetical protein